MNDWSGVHFSQTPCRHISLISRVKCLDMQRWVRIIACIGVSGTDSLHPTILSYSRPWCLSLCCQAKFRPMIFFLHLCHEFSYAGHYGSHSGIHQPDRGLGYRDGVSKCSLIACPSWMHVLSGCTLKQDVQLGNTGTWRRDIPIWSADLFVPTLGVCSPSQFLQSILPLEITRTDNRVCVLWIISRYILGSISPAFMEYLKQFVATVLSMEIFHKPSCGYLQSSAPVAFHYFNLPWTPISRLTCRFKSNQIWAAIRRI